MAREWVREGTFENGFDVVESFVTLMRRVELLCTDGSFHYTTLRMPQFFRLPFPPGGESETNENAKLTKSVIEELPSTPKVEQNTDDDEERWYMKKKAKMVPAPAPAAPASTDASTTVPCSSLPPYYNTFSEFYSNFCDNWVRTAAAVASYQPPPTWTPYSSLPFPKDSKAYYFPEAVPPFLAQDPPVLLHPERVVPLSQSEQFERSYQPNVALAPPTKTSDGITYSKLKRGVIRVKSDLNSPAPNDETSPSFFNKEAKLDRADVKPSISPINSSLHASASPRSSPVTEAMPDSGVNNSVVEQVAAVLDALSDAEDAVRQRVIHLVERLTVRIDRCDVERRKYQEEISHLQARLTHVEEQNSHLAFINSQLRIQLESKHLPPHPEPPRLLNDKDGVALNRSSTPSRKCSTPAGLRLINSSATYSPANHNTPGISSKQPNCSPVSVITSPPPLTVIKSESA
ncbi:hypothetical protein V9T40_012973 [Parthenolecanium corni]|uniref:Uncharacterized protein n=1 Tax=Parthenolecanium corni TaxID=536013 RepID=A0AAN9TLA5_9HEMI